MRTCAFNLAVPADCFKRLRDREARMDELRSSESGSLSSAELSRCVLGDSRAPVSKPQKLGPFRNRRWRGTNEAEGPRCALLIRSASRCIRRGGGFRVRVSVYERSFAWETDYLRIGQDTSNFFYKDFVPLKQYSGEL